MFVICAYAIVNGHMQLGNFVAALTYFNMSISSFGAINSGYDVDDHFAEVSKMVEAGVAPKHVLDFKLTRYACYLIVQNGDPRKEVIALGQTNCEG